MNEYILCAKMVRVLGQLRDQHLRGACGTVSTMKNCELSRYDTSAKHSSNCISCSLRDCISGWQMYKSRVLELNASDERGIEVGLWGLVFGVKGIGFRGCMVQGILGFGDLGVRG